MGINLFMNKANHDLTGKFNYCCKSNQLNSENVTPFNEKNN